MAKDEETKTATGGEENEHEEHQGDGRGSTTPKAERT